MNINSEASAAWQETAQSVGLSCTQAQTAFDVLAGYYAEPHRAYHNLTHIIRMLETIAPFQYAVRDCPVLSLAVWFHDVVYDTHQSDNEEQSAVLAASSLRPALSVPVVERIQQLILATKTHQAALDDTDSQLLIDADLAIFGSSPVDYANYARAIRQEYAWVSEADYRRGRRRVLEQFLARPRLYLSEALFSTLEQPARDNLRREIESLT